MIHTLVLLVLGFLSFVLSDIPNPSTAVWLNNNSKGARCLDGTAPLYYIRKGSTTNSTKWVIHQQGGAWCVSIDDCYNRAHSRLGSSAAQYGWQPQMDFADIPGCTNARWCGGLFVNDPVKNSLAWDWNAVFLVYCDGGSQVGSNSTETTYKGERLYFSGFNNLDAIITDLLMNHDMDKATEVIVGGDSAGGLATWIHTDYWKSRLPSTTRVVGVPDSGFFLEDNVAHWADKLTWVFHQMNGSAGINPICARYYAPTNETWKCIFAQNTAPFCQAPMFAMQSQYDQYQIGSILGSNDPSKVNPFGAQMVSLLKSNFLVRAQNGIFLDSCEHHCGGWGLHQDGDYNLIANNMTGIQAFTSWYTKSTTTQIWFQEAAYPCPTCCTGGSYTQ